MNSLQSISRMEWLINNIALLAAGMLAMAAIGFSFPDLKPSKWPLYAQLLSFFLAIAVRAFNVYLGLRRAKTIGCPSALVWAELAAVTLFSLAGDSYQTAQTTIVIFFGAYLFIAPSRVRADR